MIYLNKKKTCVQRFASFEEKKTHLIYSRIVILGKRKKILAITEMNNIILERQKAVDTHELISLFSFVYMFHFFLLRFRFPSTLQMIRLDAKRQRQQQQQQHNAERLLKLIEEIYRWLPLGTIVNNRVFVVHGGISDTTDLDLLKSLDRGKVSIYFVWSIHFSYSSHRHTSQRLIFYSYLSSKDEPNRKT